MYNNLGAYSCVGSVGYIFYWCHSLPVNDAVRPNVVFCLTVNFTVI